MINPLLIGTVVILFAFYQWSKWIQNPLRKLPGPYGLPYIGHILYMDVKRPHYKLKEWAKEYGKIFRITLFGQNVVVLNSSELLHEALHDKSVDFAGRPPLYRFKYMFFGAKNIPSQTYNPKVVQLRKIAHATLKTYGHGLPRLEEITRENISELMEEMGNLEGRPTNLKMTIHTAVCNIMATLIFGTKFNRNSKEVQEIMALNRGFSESLHPTDGAELDIYPLLRFTGYKAFRRLRDTRNLRNSFLDRHLEEAKASHEPDNLKGSFDFLVSKLSAQIARNNTAEDGIGQITEMDIKVVINDMILAGTVTTTAALQIFLLLMINYPDVQKKLQQEADMVVGQNRLPTLEDRPKMPYTEAAVLELLRHGSFVPFLLPHYTLVDTSVGGYDIPKNTQVLMNTYSVHYNEESFEKPHEYKPERFLDDEGHLLPPDHQKRKNFYAFGGGRRMCVGEATARARIFLFVASFMQRFTFSPADEENVPRADPKTYRTGAAMAPNDFEVKLIARIV